MNTIIFIVGETGSGKDTISKLLPYPVNVSWTTRPMRLGDVQGETHWFVSDEKFAKAGEMLAYTEIGPYKYGLPLGSLPDGISIYIIDPDGIKWFRDNYKKDKLKTITIGLTLPLSERLKRCVSMRKDDPKQFDERVKAETERFDKFKLSCDYDAIFTNWESHKTAYLIQKLIEEKL